MLEEVPYEQEEVWVRAWDIVMTKLHSATSEQEIDVALLWLIFLPQALLRKPTHGGKAGRGQVTKRFHAVQREDWGFLVVQWEADMAKLEERRRVGAAQIRNTIKGDDKELEVKTLHFSYFWCILYSLAPPAIRGNTA